MTNSPFKPDRLGPGNGEIHLHPLHTAQPSLQSFGYQYPLKLVAPKPILVDIPSASDLDPPTSRLVHTVYLLTYGGGIVAGDAIHLRVSLAGRGRLVLLTQGSTKVFKCPSPAVVSRSRMDVALRDDARLCYLPDPVQPYARSAFEQTQRYWVEGKGVGLCVADWVSEGRTARGERWGFERYVSRNEVWARMNGEERLLLRDNVVLAKEHGGAKDFVNAVDGLGVVGTLILYGAGFETLGKFFLEEFRAIPRIGAKKWDASDDEVEETPRERWRATRLQRETRDGVIWTAAEIRGFVLVKFGAKEVEGIKTWLLNMLSHEGAIEAAFGERALLCMRS